ncbi:hypothetical protein MNBD_DELTA03-1071 [hydrothermal vent metagenome]|uniref:Uncharacterized protein n=1 Tax=hydrothermal vent metagenome TaxID=652676 RepID=A0A3B0V5S5_9ZZZZ
MTEYVCYCFKHTARDIEADVKAHGKSTIMAAIAAAKKVGGCHCETTNPKGR